MLDRAYRIFWYNLPEEGRETYPAWLHGSYILKVLERPADGGGVTMQRCGEGL